MNILALKKRNFKIAHPRTFEKVLITPKMAEDLLKINTNNIPPNFGKIRTYSRAMREGTWVYNGDSIRISRNGVLLDGQNRLMAVVQTGVSIELNIVAGLDDQVFGTIDVGRTRQKAHIVSREHARTMTESDARVATNAITKIVRHDRGYSQTSSNTKNGSINAEVSLVDIDGFIEEHPEIIEQIKFVKKHFGSRCLISSAECVFLYHIGSRWDEEYTLKFLDKALRGIGLRDGETLMHLNQNLIKIKAKQMRWTPSQKMYTIIKVWNSVGARGVMSIRGSNNIRFKKDEAIPFMREPKAESMVQMTMDV